MVRRYAKESEIPKGGSEWRKGGAGAASDGPLGRLGRRVTEGSTIDR